MADNFETMKEIIVDKFTVKPEQVTPDARFKEDLEGDSLTMVDFTMDLEEKFDITIEDEDSAGVETVAQALAMVEAKQNA